jgi:hypothetical protein
MLGIPLLAVDVSATYADGEERRVKRWERCVRFPPSPLTFNLGGSDYVRGRKRRIVTAPDRLLLSGSRSIVGRPGAEKGMPSPSSTGSM